MVEALRGLVTGQLAPGRTCAWCGEVIPPDRRKDAETCSQPCRQARQRFRVAPAPAAAAEPMRFAIADPPYPFLSRRYYGDHPAFDGEVDHRQLVERLVEEHPDGWALCTSAAALRLVIPMCPAEIRVAIWVKGSRAGVSKRARSAYEPVLIFRGRERRLEISDELDDVLVWGGRQHSHPGALVGMKPAAFAEWVFRQLGALAGDYLTDVFPGSGAIMRAWLEYGGRNADPAAQGPELRLPIDDRITAPPVARRRHGMPSRLEEAAARARQRLDCEQETSAPQEWKVGETRGASSDGGTLVEDRCDDHITTTQGDLFE